MLHFKEGAEGGVKAVPITDSAQGPDLQHLRLKCEELQRENLELRNALLELERVAQRDTLTPLFNRRHFLSAMKKRLAMLAKDEVYGAVVFVDVNQLKRINDEFGHAAGDAALVAVAEHLQQHMGEEDLAARIGGDEFGLFLAVENCEAAQARVGEIAQSLGAAPAYLDGQAIALSACFGVAMLRGGESDVSILAEADRDMYRAKRLARARDLV